MKRLVMLCALFFLLMLPARAEAIADAQLDAVAADSIESALDDEARQLMGGERLTADFDYRAALRSIITNGKGALGSELRSAAGSAGTLMLICVLCALAEAVCAVAGSERIPNYIPLAGVLAAAVVAVGDADSFIGLGAGTIADVNDFSKALLPSLSAAAAASGQYTAAAAKFAAAAMFIDLLVTLADRVLLPLVYCYIAVTIAGAAMGGSALASASALLKWLCKSAVTTLMLAFVAYLGITGVMAGTADAVTTRVTKTVLSTTLPVVGSIVSDAASAVIAGAGVVKNLVGVFGLVGVCAVCLVPFLRLGVNYLMYKLAAGLASMCTVSSVAKLIGGIGDAFGLLMAVSGSCAVMLFISIISVIRAVSG